MSSPEHALNGKVIQRRAAGFTVNWRSPSPGSGEDDSPHARRKLSGQQAALPANPRDRR
jgi:hypothetical protein